MNVSDVVDAYWNSIGSLKNHIVVVFQYDSSQKWFLTFFDHNAVVAHIIIDKDLLISCLCQFRYLEVQ